MALKCKIKLQENSLYTYNTLMNNCLKLFPHKPEALSDQDLNTDRTFWMRGTNSTLHHGSQKNYRTFKKKNCLFNCFK